ncbi:MAG: hypothetical protein ACK55Z_14225, partial [bacterium]
GQHVIAPIGVGLRGSFDQEFLGADLERTADDGADRDRQIREQDLGLRGTDGLGERGASDDRSRLKPRGLERLEVHCSGNVPLVRLEHGVDRM